MNVQMPSGYDKSKLSEPQKSFISGIEYVMTDILNGDLVDYKNKNMLGVLKKSIVDETVDVIKKQLYIEICRLIVVFTEKEKTEERESREKLIGLIQNAVDGCARNWAEVIADNLIHNGIIVPLSQREEENRGGIRK